MQDTPIPCTDEDRHVAYRSYLLRLWRTDESATCNWHASLEDPHTGKRIGFPNLEQLFAYLMECDDRKPNSSKVD